MVCVCFSWFHFRGPMGLCCISHRSCWLHMEPVKLTRRRDSCGQYFCPMRSEVPVFFLGGLGVKTCLQFCLSGVLWGSTAWRCGNSAVESAAKEAAKCHKQECLEGVSCNKCLKNKSFQECPTGVFGKSVAQGCQARLSYERVPCKSSLQECRASHWRVSCKGLPQEYFARAS